IIFVEVALVQGLASNIQELLYDNASTQDLDKIDTAIFYSISNAQKGLAGISFGNFLIKQVTNHLSSEMAQLKQFATLSPIPGFRRWLENLSGDELANLPGNSEWLQSWHRQGFERLQMAAEDEREALMQLATIYLCKTKRRGGVWVRDPVANFHLRNGAQIAQINWMADSSENGLRQSCG